jgi:hypothetical protein
MKTTDAAKLQDEYAKLVEGLQEGTDEQSDEDAFMASPGSCPFRSAGLDLRDGFSASGRPAEGGNTWQHSKGRTLRGVLEAFCRVS